MDTKSLQSLKVPELKAKCKELKIPNFSKLSKADLIVKILEANPDKTNAASDISLGKNSGVESASRQEKASAKQAGVGKEGKVIAGKNKRKATVDDKGEDAADSAKRANVAEGGAMGTSSATSELHMKHTSQDVAVASCSGDTPAQVSNPKSNAKPANKSPHIPHIPPVLSSHTDIVPDHASISRNVPKRPADVPKAQEKAKIIKKSAAVPDTTQSDSRPQAVSKPTSTKLPNKNKAKAATANQKSNSAAKPKFQALTRTKPVQPHIPVSGNQDIPVIDLTTPVVRIEYLETLFLNSLFIKLHRYRAKPITGPCYPSPLSFSKSSKLPQLSHLAFQGFHPDVYFKIDSEGFNVALRFWIARMHSYMQLGAGEAWSANAGGMGMMGSDMATWPPIVGVERVSEEIWAISTEEDEKVRYLVIGRIGEVVASSRGSGSEGGELVSGCKLRNDWAKYLTASSRKKLEAMVKTKDSYGFPSGVARAWSAKQGEGMLTIARRAVLASCALSSFSGEKLSSTMMDAAYNGRPTTGGVASNDLDFYLPENFQILSVHLPSGLHPALAIVQRGSGFSEFILAETGQMVGLEDEGVVSLWQGLLGCDAKGKATESGHTEFWKRWESRMKLI